MNLIRSKAFLLLTYPVRPKSYAGDKKSFAIGVELLYKGDAD